MPSMDPTQDRSAGSTPAIPAFASLRDPSRRSPVDVLIPTEPPPVTATAQPVAPRPPEWADLLHLAVHLLRWSVRAPARQVRRLLGA